MLNVLLVLSVLWLAVAGSTTGLVLAFAWSGWFTAAGAVLLGMAGIAGLAASVWATMLIHMVFPRWSALFGFLASGIAAGFVVAFLLRGATDTGKEGP